jgi:N-acetylmuramoyl-L-alanine amidase
VTSPLYKRQSYAKAACYYVLFGSQNRAKQAATSYAKAACYYVLFGSQNRAKQAATSYAKAACYYVLFGSQNRAKQAATRKISAARKPEGNGDDSGQRGRSFFVLRTARTIKVTNINNSNQNKNDAIIVWRT